MRKIYAASERKKWVCDFKKSIPINAISKKYGVHRSIIFYIKDRTKAID